MNERDRWFRLHKPPVYNNWAIQAENVNRDRQWNAYDAYQDNRTDATWAKFELCSDLNRELIIYQTMKGAV